VDMKQNQIQQEITIIKDMIEKTRRETAESGLLFIIPGILCILTIFLMALLEMYQLNHLFLPALLTAMAVIVITSAVIGIKEGKKERIETYAKSIFAHVWIACGICCLITGLIFPISKIYPWHFVSIIPLLFIGIAFYITGVIYKIRIIQWSALLWWFGASLLAFVEGSYRPFILIIIFLFGYILPGIILNKQYKSRSITHEA
jgi:hypothetical protein